MSLHVDHITAPGETLSFGQEFAYGLGAIANNLLGAAIGHMSIALDAGRGMNPALVGTRQAIPRFTDALTDPVMGCISDNSRSRYDRRRSYSVSVAPFFTGNAPFLKKMRKTKDLTALPGILMHFLKTL